MKIKALLYCTKGKPYLEYKQIPRTLMEIDNSFEGYRCSYKRTEDDENFQLNGKIVAECDFEVEKIEYKHIKERDEFGILHNEAWQEYRGLNITDSDCDLTSKSCLTADEIFDYLLNKNGYAIHIKNLHIFDEPKELSEYCSVHYLDGGTIGTKLLTKAPQNMMRVVEASYYNFYYESSDINILISIRPEWLCKILNGEKTIEVRKVVLKEMIK